MSVRHSLLFIDMVLEAVAGTFEGREEEEINMINDLIKVNKEQENFLL